MARSENRLLYMDIAAAYFRYEALISQVVLGARQDLSKTQLMILIFAGVSGSCSMGELSGLLAVSREQVSRATAALERDGYIVKRRDEENGRVVRFSLTEKAEEYLRGHRERMDAAFDEAFAGVAEEDLHELARASRAASASIDKAARAIGCPSPATEVEGI